MNMLKIIMPPIHRAGHPFIGLFALATAATVALLAWQGQTFWLLPAAMVGLILTAWCTYFFRDPVRFTPQQPGLFVSPADGVVQAIVEGVPPAELQLGEASRQRVSIFLNVFNVHVNRIPIAGTISHLHYHPGKFLNASLDKASEENERQLVQITLADGQKIGVVQIAGLVARRILCHLKPGQQVRTGERFGLIRFGSRTDLYLPPGVQARVGVGQIMVGGETIIADLHAQANSLTFSGE